MKRKMIFPRYHSLLITIIFYSRVVPGEITQQQKGTQPCIIFILTKLSVYPMRVHNPEYKHPVTSVSRVTGCTNFVN